jgi:hypothetical protein
VTHSQEDLGTRKSVPRVEVGTSYINDGHLVRLGFDHELISTFFAAGLSPLGSKLCLSKNSSACEVGWTGSVVMADADSGARPFASFVNLDWVRLIDICLIAPQVVPQDDEPATKRTTQVT